MESLNDFDDVAILDCVCVEESIEDLVLFNGYDMDMSSVREEVGCPVADTDLVSDVT